MPVDNIPSKIIKMWMNTQIDNNYHQILKKLYTK